MKKEIKDAVEKYQCPGCVKGSDTSCYKPASFGVGCADHMAGTRILGLRNGADLLWLGMPKCFNRLGPAEHKAMLELYESDKDFTYNELNVPVWKHLTDEGHVLVRGLCPRTNRPFTHVFLSADFDSIKAMSITKEFMDKCD